MSGSAWAPQRKWLVVAIVGVCVLGMSPWLALNMRPLSSVQGLVLDGMGLVAGLLLPPRGVLAREEEMTYRRRLGDAPAPATSRSQVLPVAIYLAGLGAIAVMLWVPDLRSATDYVLTAACMVAIGSAGIISVRGALSMRRVELRIQREIAAGMHANADLPGREHDVRDAWDDAPPRARRYSAVVAGVGLGVWVLGCVAMFAATQFLEPRTTSLSVFIAALTLWAIGNLALLVPIGVWVYWERRWTVAESRLLESIEMPSLLEHLNRAQRPRMTGEEWQNKLASQSRGTWLAIGVASGFWIVLSVMLVRVTSRTLSSGDWLYSVALVPLYATLLGSWLSLGAPLVISILRPKRLLRALERAIGAQQAFRADSRELH